MDRAEALHRLKFLYDQVHQTGERAEHLPERLPLDIHPESLNYERDLTQVQGDYNRLISSVQEAGLLTPAELEREGLPLRFEQGG